jgi:hypothetical protein
MRAYQDETETLHCAAPVDLGASSSMTLSPSRLLLGISKAFTPILDG